MDNDKERGVGGGYMHDDEKNEGHGARARNRTVMLTPEITNQVRNRFQQESETPQSGAVAPSTPSPGGFYTPTGTGRVLAAPAPASTTPVAAMTQHKGDFVSWTKPSKIVGFLVSYDNDSNGWVCELRVGRLIVSNQVSQNDSTLVVQDDSVSSMHAIIRVGPNGDVQILDQLSEVGTRIRRGSTGEEEMLSGERATVTSGDVIFFGNRKFCVLLMPEKSFE